MGHIGKECPKNKTYQENGWVQHVLVKLAIEPAS
jgi:hypothetical protein